MARSAAYVFSPFSCSPAQFRPREQMNQLTSYIDASLVYGSSEEHMRQLREQGGFGAKLSMDFSTGWTYPPRQSNTECKVAHQDCNNQCFHTGERRANENPVLGSLHTVWAREHNRLVDRLRSRGWPEETLFYVVRKIVGALMQHITYREYLPLILGKDLPEWMELRVPSSNYRYDPSINPTIFNVFATAAFRFGHSMISGHHMRQGTSYSGSPLLSEDFFSMEEFCRPRDDPVVVLLSGQAAQRAQRVDYLFSRQVTNHLFAKETNGLGLDLFSVNVQRGRDHGLPPYNRWREACGLPRARDYSDLLGTLPDFVIDRLSIVYGPGGVDEVDLFVAGVSEFPVNGGILGPTFTCIISNQFKALKFGDRFWYENQQHAGRFTPEQIFSIQQTTLASLICRNSDLVDMQQMALLTESVDNPKVPCEFIVSHTDLDLNLWP